LKPRSPTSFTEIGRNDDGNGANRPQREITP
jgi:hypothetical protein